ncbi:PucR family transcriptional regulator [Nocardioides sp.]|uniref:PucR family transcriptional regulator n=1 Tax=Nocardioides sp. TaxID=35761 RepID=UPI003512D093
MTTTTRRSTGGTIPPRRARAATTLSRSSGRLGTRVVTRMDAEMPWFRDLGAEERSWVGQIVQAGIRAFVEWYRQEGTEGPDGADADVPLPATPGVTASVFGVAPRALAGVISLRQTVDLVRLTIEVVEQQVPHLLPAEDVGHVREAVVRYGREVAFATAEVYARAAEVRGAWDARLEALVVDSVLRSERDESLMSRASALGWAGRADVCAVLADLPAELADRDVRGHGDLVDAVRRRARESGMDALGAVQGARLVVLLGGAPDPRAAAATLLDLVGTGPVVVGPRVGDLSQAHVSARAALAGHRAVGGWPDAPRPVMSADLLPERALAGDVHARRHLVEEVYAPLARARGPLVESLDAYLAQGGSVEATARALFVHPNTVRYRLRQITEATGFAPHAPREALALQLALILGRQYDARPASWRPEAPSADRGPEDDPETVADGPAPTPASSEPTL